MIQQRKIFPSKHFPEKLLSILIPVIAVLFAFLVGSLLIIAWGSSPWEAYKSLFEGAFGTANAWAATLIRTTPLIFTGLAVAYGYRSGFFNIGAEGQLYMGALAATWVGITFINLPAALLIPLCLLASAFIGALMALIPGILKAWKGLNEVLTTLLLNYILLQFFDWSIRLDYPTAGAASGFRWINWLGVKDPSQPYAKSAFIAQQAWLPSLTGLLESPWVSNTFGHFRWYQELLLNPAMGRITLAPVLGVLFAVLTYFILFKTSTGFRARSVGVNPYAAEYMGVDVKKSLLLTSIISGALAGLAGAVEILGSQHRLMDHFLVDAGFTGIPVALLGNLQPYGILLSALFFGALRAGANRMQIITQVPIATVQVIQALAILFAIAASALDIQTRIKKARMSGKLSSQVDPPSVPGEVFDGG